MVYLKRVEIFFIIKDLYLIKKFNKLFENKQKISKGYHYEYNNIKNSKRYY